MGFLFTSESVSSGHPDKVADSISDALLDEFLRRDPEAKVACETLVTTGMVVCAGEVKTTAYVDIQECARQTILDIGYTKGEYRFDGASCGLLSAIHSQSPDINRGVERKKAEDQGAGDQGLMFGYACREMDNLMPMPIELAHILLQELEGIRKEGKQMTYLRPDAKSQVTVHYNDAGKPDAIDTIVISTQHDEFDTEKKMLARITEDIRNILIPRVLKTLPKRVQKLFDKKYKLYVNPTGKFVIGGPHGDTGLTGRKIIVDTYGGRAAHGGGAFSGKDSSKVDRSAAYAARYIAKNMVAAGVADEMLVQISYAIGIARPLSIYVDTYGTSKVSVSDGRIAERIGELFDLRPAAIVAKFGLKNPIFEATASYGHFGNRPYTKSETIWENGVQTTRDVEFFGWEKLDSVDMLKKEFGL